MNKRHFWKADVQCAIAAFGKKNKRKKNRKIKKSKIKKICKKK